MIAATHSPAWTLALALSLCAGAALNKAHAEGPARKSVPNAVKAAPGDWPSHGLDAAETRFSPLKRIDASNVGQLGLVWSYDLGSSRGVESTPLVVDGVMYVTAPWSIVHAIDARTGKKRWTYDPKVPRSTGIRACCDVVNRGVALYKGKVFVGSFDGRLVAIDAATGRKVWEKDTIVDHGKPYSITGAPRVYKGKVIIGNGGADYGVRGYVTAYDADTGAQKWRWFTVPGNPDKPHENEAMAKAAKTWDPSAKFWETGGGGTVWDSMAFDPSLNLLYIGVGNASPWARSKRSPAGGDNLYLASVVALNLDTGEYVWHYQETPGDNSDFTSTQQITLADLMLDGKPRKVILHAPKNGFFFVIDRTNGQFISAKNFVDVNWATGYDEKGRPIETPLYRSDKPREIIPSPFGAHSWQSMSFSPLTGLVYLPAQHVPLNLMDDAGWKSGKVTPGQPQAGTGWNTAMYANAVPPTSAPFGRLIAWDPIAQKEVWRQEHVAPWNGGTLATAGNLVFQGTADGRFVAYNATTGAKLWESPTGTGVVAAPISYEVRGQQYVSIAVGWGGVFGLTQRATDRQTPGTVYTFAVGGKARLPEFTKYQLNGLLAGVKYDPAHVQPGMMLYVSHCVFCHGVPAVDKGGNLPNLAYVGREYIEHLQNFVFKGPFTDKGMPDFTGKLTAEDVTKIQAFIQGTADAVRPKPAAAEGNKP